jgi:Protein of unknown function (DUF1488)
MPLWRADEAYDWNGDFVSFPMTDGKTRIVCRISREALEDRASADGRGELLADLPEVFLMHRERIEQIASAKHDAGDSEHLARTADLNRRA